VVPVGGDDCGAGGAGCGPGPGGGFGVGAGVGVGVGVGVGDGPCANAFMPIASATAAIRTLLREP